MIPAEEIQQKKEAVFQFLRRDAEKEKPAWAVTDILAALGISRKDFYQLFPEGKRQMFKEAGIPISKKENEKIEKSRKLIEVRGKSECKPHVVGSIEEAERLVAEGWKPFHQDTWLLVPPKMAEDIERFKASGWEVEWTGSEWIITPNEEGQKLFDELAKKRPRLVNH